MPRDFSEAWKLGRGVEAVAMLMAEDFFAKVPKVHLEPISDEARNHREGDFQVVGATGTIECKGQSKIDPNEYGGLNFVEVFEDRDERKQKDPRHLGQSKRLAEILTLTPEALRALRVEDRRSKPPKATTVGDVQYMSVEIEPLTRASLVVYYGNMTAYLYVYRATNLLQELIKATRSGVPFW